MSIFLFEFEWLVNLVICVLLLVMVLLSVAFITLLEQKVLGSIQVRLGPNYVSVMGLLQPIADAVKLFCKGLVSAWGGNLTMFMVMPLLSLCLSLAGWLVILFKGGGVIDFYFSFLFFFCVSGGLVYPLMLMGWSSNCKYSMYGGLRSVAQMVSYEVSLALVLLSVFWVEGVIDVKNILMGQISLWNIFIMGPLGVAFFVSCLAEVNRTPYDFSEGESELVSGFNTEYSAGEFTLIFISEYSSVIFMSMVFSFVFLGGSLGMFCVFKGILVVSTMYWVRGTMPRTRYDKLMNTAWKVILPCSLMILVYYLAVGVL